MSQLDFFLFLPYFNTDKRFNTINETGKMSQDKQKSSNRQTLISNCDSQTPIFIFYSSILS